MLSILLWRAALFLGDEEDVVRAFDVCMEQAGGFIAYDLTTQYASGVIGAIFKRESYGGAEEESVLRFLKIIRTLRGRYAGFHVDDYSALVAHLMRSRGVSRVALHAAFCLADRMPESDLGKEGKDRLQAAAAAGHTEAEELLAKLSALE